MQNGDTSLHISAAMGRRKLTRVLLESGCDREMKNKQGETAAEIARRKSLAEIVQILKNTQPSISINPSEKYGKSAPQMYLRYEMYRMFLPYRTYLQSGK